jgi:hypothetical protein
VLELPPGTVTARQLIEAAVTAEVAAYEARAEEASLVAVLTHKSLADGLAQGAVRSGGNGGTDSPPVRSGDLGGIAPPGKVDVAAAVDAALLAFGDGFFKVFVGDSELADDDSPVSVADGEALLFLRLVPLAGG